MIGRFFRRELDQNEQLLKNIEEYEKKKAKQQESEILVKRKKGRASNKKERVNVRTKRS